MFWDPGSTTDDSRTRTNQINNFPGYVIYSFIIGMWVLFCDRLAVGSDMFLLPT